MDSFEKAAKIMKRIFQAKSRIDSNNSYNLYDFSYWVKDRNESLELYESIHNCINNPLQTFDNLLLVSMPSIHTFGINFGFQNVIAFFCMHALVERMPVLQGEWESVIRNIIINSKDCVRCLQYLDGQKLLNSEEACIRWLDRIQMLCSPKNCPNPCLRLEIIKLKVFFTPLFCDTDYSKESFQELTINTLCEILEKYPDITKEQIRLSPDEFYKTIIGNSIDIQSIVNKCNPKSRQTTIIQVVMKITLMYAHNVMVPFGGDSFVDLDICSKFCGLLPEENNFKTHISFFIKSIINEPILLDYVKEICHTIYDTSSRIGNNHPGHYNPRSINRGSLIGHTKIRETVLYMIYKQLTNNIPLQQHLREIHGGITSATEYRLRYFTDNITFYDKEMNDDNEDNLSEEDSLDEVGYQEDISEDDVSEYDSEDDVSENDVSEEDVSEEDVFSEEDDFSE